MATPAKTKPTPADYERLGRVIEATMITDYVQLLGNTRRQIWLSFVRGVFTGLGTVVGATVVVALIVWILHLFGGVPVVGQFLTHTTSQIKQ
ncbi:MAG TPA: DUF5665 domain-containing protein [Candidatus Saccharimonadales bacterium]|nr:DUF5665 domain-containing protein [Candidatus Saccharimonadales bacterium]